MTVCTLYSVYSVHSSICDMILQCDVIVCTVVDEQDDPESKTDEERTELLSDGYSSDTVRSIKASVPLIDRYTVMIRNLPVQFRDERILFGALNRVFPDTIAKVIVVRDVRDLTRIQNEIEFHRAALQRLSEKHGFTMDQIHDDAALPQVFES